MSGYVDIGGHSMWVEERGSGDETVLLLHGGLSSCDDLLGTIGPSLAERYRVVAFDRIGHGRTADTDAPFHYSTMADQALGVLDEVVGGPAHLVGFSDGGIIGLLLAIGHPDRLRRLVAIGANFHFSGLMPLPIVEGSPEAEMLADSYAQRSPDGRGHFATVFGKTEQMFATEPTLTVEDLRAISTPTLVMAGDDDAVRLDHTCALYESLPNGQLAIVPGASHLLPIEKPLVAAQLVLEFLGQDGPPATFMPIRRSG